MKKIILMMCVCFVSFSIANAEPLTLKQQITENVPIEEIQCSNPTHLLSERPNGKLACTSEYTVKKLGWELVNPIEQNISSVYPIIRNGTSFDVEYEIKDGIITDMSIVDGITLVIMIDSSADGQLSLNIPQGVMDPLPENSKNYQVFVLMNEEEIPTIQSTDSEFNRTVMMNFTDSNPKIELIATWFS